MKGKPTAPGPSAEWIGEAFDQLVILERQHKIRVVSIYWKGGSTPIDGYFEVTAARELADELIVNNRWSIGDGMPNPPEHSHMLLHRLHSQPFRVEKGGGGVSLDEKALDWIVVNPAHVILADLRLFQGLGSPDTSAYMLAQALQQEAELVHKEISDISHVLNSNKAWNADGGRSFQGHLDKAYRAARRAAAIAKHTLLGAFTEHYDPRITTFVPAPAGDAQRAQWRAHYERLDPVLKGADQIKAALGSALKAGAPKHVFPNQARILADQVLNARGLAHIPRDMLGRGPVGLDGQPWLLQHPVRDALAQIRAEVAVLRAPTTTSTTGVTKRPEIRRQQDFRL